VTCIPLINQLVDIYRAYQRSITFLQSRREQIYNYARMQRYSLARSVCDEFVYSPRNRLRLLIAGLSIDRAISVSMTRHVGARRLTLRRWLVSFVSFYRQRNAIVILDGFRKENPSASNAARCDTDQISLRDNLSLQSSKNPRYSRRAKIIAILISNPEFERFESSPID